MPLTEQQLAERLSYIGASEAAAVLGLSRWSTPLKIWAEKTGQLPPEDKSDIQAVEMGLELEDTIARIFTKRTGKRVHRVNETVYHPKYPFIAANLDRRVVGEDAVLEIKNFSAWRAREFQGEEIPAECIVQVLHQLACTGKSVGYLAVLIGGQDFRWRKIDRDDKVIADMITREIHFWKNFVEPKVMPMKITKDDAETLYSLFPVADESEEIPLDDDANRIIEGLEAMKADLRTLEGSIEREENQLKAMLKDKAAGRTDRYKVTWKNMEQCRVDTKRLKEEAPDVYAKFKNKISFRKLWMGSLKETD